MRKRKKKCPKRVQKLRREINKENPTQLHRLNNMMDAQGYDVSRGCI